MSEPTPRQEAIRRTLWLARQAGFDTSDRMEFAKAMLDLGERRLESYTQLNDAELDDLRFALEGWWMTQRLRLANGTLTRESLAQVKLEIENGSLTETQAKEALGIA